MKKKELPGLLIIAAAGHFEPGLAIRGCFGMNAKSKFSYVTFIYGRPIVLARETLLERFDRARRLFPRKYADPRKAFNGQIEVETLSSTEIRDAIEHYHVYAKAMTFPAEYLRNLESALKINPKSDCLVACETVY